MIPLYGRVHTLPLDVVTFDLGIVINYTNLSPVKTDTPSEHSNNNRSQNNTKVDTLILLTQLNALTDHLSVSSLTQPTMLKNRTVQTCKGCVSTLQSEEELYKFYSHKYDNKSRGESDVDIKRPSQDTKVKSVFDSETEISELEVQLERKKEAFIAAQPEFRYEDIWNYVNGTKLKKKNIPTFQPDDWMVHVRLYEQYRYLSTPKK